MDYATWLSFAAMIFVATIAPGPNILVVIITRITSGFRGVFWAISGNLCANALITLFAVLGSRTLIEMAGDMLLFIYSIIGGLFLFYLGFQTLRNATASSRRLNQKSRTLSVTRENGTNAIRAFLTTFTNPKVILFQSIVLPQFLDFDAPILGQYLIMMATICMSVFIIHSAYAHFASLALNAFGSSKNRTALRLIHISGFTFLFFGVLLMGRAFLGNLPV